jgi:hypothetical protein
VASVDFVPFLPEPVLMKKSLFGLLGFVGVGVIGTGTACSSNSDCTCTDATVAMFPDPIDVSEDTITFEVKWEGGSSTCVAGANETECSLANTGSRFVDVVYDTESQDIDMGGSGIGQGIERLPIVLGVSVEGILDEVQVTFSEPERAFSTQGSPIDTEESACGGSCLSREMVLVEL